MSIKRNFMFSSILTVSNYIFPFIVYPYVARVLGPTNVGICNFVDSIVNYAMLLSLMGITIIGTRNIAKAKSDPEKLNETFTSLFILTAVFTLISTAALVIVTYTVPKLFDYRQMLLIGLVKLWGNFLLIDWLYKGLEDFRYITIRTILVKIGFIAAVFIFIHVAKDYVTYFLLLCLMVAVNAAFNCFRAARIIKFKYSFAVIKGCFNSFIILGIYLLLNSMYTTFNVTYLGIACGDEEVGYYSTSTKIFKIILALYTAYSSVVLPRASALLSQGKKEEFKHLISQSINGLVLFSIPIMLFSILFCPGIVYTIAGAEYSGSILPMIIVMPLLFIIGYEQILVIQILTPLASDKVILLNSIIGASVGIIFNLLLVHQLAAVGSAIVWVIAEMAVLIASQYFVTKRTGLKFPFKLLFNNIVAYSPLVIASAALILFTHIGDIPAMVIGMVMTAVYFFAIQSKYLKNPIYVASIEKANGYLRKLKP